MSVVDTSPPNRPSVTVDAAAPERSGAADPEPSVIPASETDSPEGKLLADGEQSAIGAVNREWFERGLREQNFALYHASLFPLRDELSQVIREHLGEAHPVDPPTLGLLVDEAMHVAFTHRDDWPYGEDLVGWLAHFVDQAIEQFDQPLD